MRGILKFLITLMRGLVAWGGRSQLSRLGRTPNSK